MAETTTVKPSPTSRKARASHRTPQTKPGLSLDDRRAFLRLPLEERRRRLTEQAQVMLSCYENEKSRTEWQGGDIVEY